MGWWEADAEGNSLQPDGGLFWGDEPADRLSDALDAIDRAFERELGRKPTLAELQSGLLFSARVRYEETPEPSTVKIVHRAGGVQWTTDAPLWEPRD